MTDPNDFSGAPNAPLPAFAVVFQPLVNPTMQLSVKHHAVTKQEVWNDLRENHKFVARDEHGAIVNIVDLEGCLTSVMDWESWEVQAEARKKQAAEAALRQQLVGGNPGAIPVMVPGGTRRQ